MAAPVGQVSEFALGKFCMHVGVSRNWWGQGRRKAESLEFGRGGEAGGVESSGASIASLNNLFFRQRLAVTGLSGIRCPQILWISLCTLPELMRYVIA